MKKLGETLAAARTSRGWTLEDVARKTRIAEEYLAAIEAGQLQRLPAGPYAAAWIRSYCNLLDVEEPVDAILPTQWHVPLWIVRALGVVSLTAALASLGFLQWGPDLAAPPAPTAVDTPDQSVKITPRKNVSLIVEVDGERVFDGPIPDGEEREFIGYRRIEVRVPSVDSVRIVFNGNTIVPQGRQDVPRRLIFGKDGG